jgi:hypothetical protein
MKVISSTACRCSSTAGATSFGSADSRSRISCSRCSSNARVGRRVERGQVVQQDLQHHLELGPAQQLLTRSMDAIKARFDAGKSASAYIPQDDQAWAAVRLDRRRAEGPARQAGRACSRTWGEPDAGRFVPALCHARDCPRSLSADSGGDLTTWPLKGAVSCTLKRPRALQVAPRNPGRRHRPAARRRLRRIVRKGRMPGRAGGACGPEHPVASRHRRTALDRSWDGGRANRLALWQASAAGPAIVTDVVLTRHVQGEAAWLGTNPPRRQHHRRALHECLRSEIKQLRWGVTTKRRVAGVHRAAVQRAGRPAGDRADRPGAADRVGEQAYSHG